MRRDRPSPHGRQRAGAQRRGSRPAPGRHSSPQFETTTTGVGASIMISLVASNPPAAKVDACRARSRPDESCFTASTKGPLPAISPTTSIAGIPAQQETTIRSRSTTEPSASEHADLSGRRS